MANNIFVTSYEPSRIRLLVYSRSASMARYLNKVSRLARFLEVYSAHTYKEAFELINHRDPDVVVIHADINALDDLLEARRINKIWKESRRRTPKIFAISNPKERDVCIAKRFGFHDITALPTTPNYLSQRILNALENLE